jgi:hypothetical protein
MFVRGGAVSSEITGDGTTVTASICSKFTLNQQENEPIVYGTSVVFSAKGNYIVSSMLTKNKTPRNIIKREYFKQEIRVLGTVLCISEIITAASITTRRRRDSSTLRL